MKFDCIIMNPPYKRNLHLKILAEAIKHLNDDDSVCVNLSPVRWLQDPVARYKKHSDYNKFEESVSKHIKNLEIISTIDSQQLFNVLINTDIGIYELTKSCLNSYAYVDEWKKTTNEKHFNNIKKYWNYPDLECYSEVKNKKLWFVPIRLITNPARATFYNICSNIGPIFNKKTITNISYKDAMYKSKTFSDDRQLRGIWFSSKEQAFNFYNSTLTICYKYFCSLVLRDVHISLAYLPWLGDAVNPRTGLKGYESEWTNDDLYKFFNITSEEQKVIEETMKKYK